MANTATAKKNGKPEEKEEPRRIDVDFKGDRFVIPEDMDYDEAIEALVRQRDEERTEVQVFEKVAAFPLDGAVAFQKALKERYGWTNLAPTPGFWGDSPPSLIGVEVGFGETLQIPWGVCRVPKIDGTVSTGYTQDHNGMPIFQLSATVRRRYEKTIADIAKRVREIVQTNSIYRGKAVKINFRDSDGDRASEFKPTFAPRFIDLKKYAGQQIVYAADTERMIHTNLFNPVMFTQRCRTHGIPLKRGVLLEGKYGTGKTLTAHMLAQKCVENGWTFLYLEDVRDLDMAFHFARMYAPCVLFAEDVDRSMPNGNRTTDIDRILNTLDGVESKNVEVMTVLTTNSVNGIHPSFLRPGRIDTVIPVLPPDDQAMLKLVRMYGRGKDGMSLIGGTDEELIASVKGLKGTNASFVQEAVERAKLGAVAASEEMLIKPEDIKTAVASMAAHLKLVCPDAGMEIEEDDQVYDPLRFGFDLVMDQFAFAILNKLADPKVLHKIVLKAGKKSGGRRKGGDHSLN